MAKEIDHSERAHAMLSASGSSRWIACTPSPRLEEASGIEDSSSSYAQEGTDAHELAEARLRLVLNEKDSIAISLLRDLLNKSEYYGPEMEDEVAKYADYVLNIYREAKSSDGGAEIFTEQRVDFSAYVKDGFGSLDNSIISDDILHVIDLKYGKGIEVSAVDNSQLKLYALGLFEKLNISYDIHTIRLHIVQPRLDNVSTFDLSIDDLLAWANNVVKPKALAAYKGLGKTVAGDHCRYCKVAPVCKALAAKNLEIAKMDFLEPNMLSDDELIEVYALLPSLTKWAKQVSDHVFKEALKGTEFAGFKLVEGRSNRVVSDEASLAEMLRLEGLEDEDIYNKKIKGVTDLTKKLGAKLFKEVVNPYLVKPAGAPTLVPLSDKRPALGAEQARLDFK